MKPQSRFMFNGERFGGIFSTMEYPFILINWSYMRTVKKWKRQVIALFCHEITHAIQWVFVCRFNIGKYYRYTNFQEKQADKIQDFVLKMLGY